MKCSKCGTINTGDSRFCKKCATHLPLDNCQVSFTRTLETTTDELARGVVFAGRYEIIEELGAGGMGRVYRAHDTKLNEEVALKLIRPEIVIEKRTTERFRNEIKLARKITHKNVCRMYDFHEEGKTLYLTMEYVRGEDLKSLIHRTKALTVGAALAISRQVAEGLGEAHKLGVVHRDLKPGNIMIDKDGDAKIMDFGIARSLMAKGVTGEGVIVGTLEYMSPEQVEGKAADARSDIYTLGVILFEMVTGHTPFEGETPLAVAHKHKYEPAPDPKKINPQIPLSLSRIILRCLEKALEKRYQTTGELLADLIAVEKGLPSAERTTAKHKPLSSREITVKLTPKKLLIPAGVLIAVAGIIFALLKFFPRREGSSPSTRPQAVAVLYFKNTTGDNSFDSQKESLCHMLIARLSQSRFFNVLNMNQIYGLLKRLKLNEQDNYTPEELIRIASRGLATHIVQGNLSRSGERFRIVLTLKNASAQEIIPPEIAEGIGEQSFFTMVDELAGRLKSSLGLSAQQIASDINKDISQVFTSSPEAFKFYAQGYQYMLSTEVDRAILCLEKAVAIDSKFAMAYLWLGLNHWFFGRRKECRTNLQNAFDLRERASERERLFIEGEFYQYISEKTWDKAIDAYSKLLKLYPLDIFGKGELAFLYFQMEEWDKAIDLYEVLRRNKDENTATYQILAWSYTSKGQPDKAKEVLEDYLNTIADNGFLRANLSMVYCIKGDLEKAKLEINKAYNQVPENVRFFKLLYLLCKEDFKALEPFYKDWEASPNALPAIIGKRGISLALRGRIKEATASFSRDLEKGRDELDPESLAVFTIFFAHLLERTDDFPGALSACETGLRLAKEMGDGLFECMAIYRRGVIQARKGKLEDARLTAEELGRAVESWAVKKRIIYHDALLGLIALQMKDISSAKDHLQKALALTPHENGEWHRPRPEFLEYLAETYELAGRWNDAQKAYEEILSLKTPLLLDPAYAIIIAQSYYKLGKALECLGDKNGAAAIYRKFLDLWKDADLELPEVEDARNRLAALKGPQIP